MILGCPGTGKQSAWGFRGVPKTKGIRSEMQGSGGACQLEELHEIHVRKIDIAVLGECRDSLHILLLRL